jgi:serine protease Do
MKLKTWVLLGALALSAGVVSAQTPPATAPAQGVYTLLGGGNYLGVVAEDLDAADAQRLNLRERRGVLVTAVRDNSPAAKAGLQKDDVIVRFDGEDVASMRKLTRLIEESAPEQKVRLKVLRNGQDKDFEVTLAARRSGFEGFATVAPEVWATTTDGVSNLRGRLGELEAGQRALTYTIGQHRRIGVSTSGLTEQLREYFGVSGKTGILITAVEKDSPAAKAGLKAGDVITAADGEKVDDSGDLMRAINKKQEGDITLTVIRDKAQRTVTVAPEKIKSPYFQGFSTTPRPAVRVAPTIRAMPVIRVAPLVRGRILD